MAQGHINGELGEKEVVKLACCPNCGKKLMQLPKNYPLFDLQCSGCSFRAQVKSSKSKPQNQIRGAGWLIMDKVLKSGYTVPPLIVNYKWKEGKNKKHQIHLFPFIPKENLKSSLRNIRNREGYEMFDYIGLSKLPQFVLTIK
jgi:Dam-replacing family